MAGEAQRTGQYPVAGSAAFDIWEGLWLGREKVALKTIRGVQVSQDTRKVRWCVPRVNKMTFQNSSRGSFEKSPSGERSGQSIAVVISCRSTVLASRMDHIRMFS